MGVRAQVTATQNILYPGASVGQPAVLGHLGGQWGLPPGDQGGSQQGSDWDS